MRLNLILLILLVALGIGVSFILIPRDKDVALLKLRSDEPDEAREVLLEQYDQGDRSVSVVASLAEIAIHQGEIPTAVKLLEDYVAANPKDVTARRRLAEYYRYDQRQDDYLAMLADVVARDGTPEERRLLVDRYRLNGDHELMLTALADIIELGEGDRRDYLEASALAAALKRRDQSLAITEQLWRDHPESLNAASVKLYVLVAAAAGQDARAETAIARLASGPRGPAAIGPVIREVAVRDQAEFGLRLLSQFEGTLHHAPTLLVAWARMQQSVDQELVAMTRLRELEEAGELPDLAVPVLLDLALQAGDIDLIAAMLTIRRMTDLGDSRLRSIADLAVFHRHTVLLNQFMDQTRDELKDREPALVAEVLLALGRPEEAAARVAQARRLIDPRLDQMLRRARAEIRLGQEEAAGVTLDLIANSADLNDSAMRDLAYLYIQTERTAQGLAAFGRLRQQRPSLAAENGWARLAAAEGRDDELRAWLNTRSGLSEELLTDIVDLSAPDRAPRAALEAAWRLFSQHPGRESQRIYGEALLASGRIDEAIELLSELLPGNDDEAEAWIAALTAAERGADALDFLKARSAEAPLAARLADDMIYLALGQGEPELAYREVLSRTAGTIEDDALAAVIDRAARARRLDIIEGVLAGTSPDFMTARPVLAAQIALARGHRATAMAWAVTARERPVLSNAEAVALVGVLTDLDQSERALTLLQTLAADPDTPAWVLNDLGARYVALDRAADGLAIFRRLMGERDNRGIAEAWARLETIAGDPAAVLAWLDAYPEPSRQLLTDIYYMAVERPSEPLFLDTSARLLDGFPDEGSQRLRVEALLAAGKGGDALPLIENLLPGDDALAELYVATLTGLDRRKDALDFLLARAKGKALPLRLADDLIGLAFGTGQADIAYAEAAQHSLSDLPEDVLAALAENAANDERYDLFDRLHAELGRGFLDARPVLAARMALARDRKATALAWAVTASARPELGTEDAVALAGVFEALDRPERSLALLKNVAEDPETPDWALTSLGAQFVALDRAPEGLAIFRGLREARDERGVAEAWARLEAIAGDWGRAQAWLAEQPEPTRQILSDLYFIALDRPAPALAQMASARLLALYPDDGSRRLRVDALLAAGEPEAALPLIEALLPGDDTVAELYVAALGQLGRQSEALDFLIARADGAPQPPNLADDFIGLAFGRGRAELAYGEAGNHRLSDLPDPVLAALAENAANDRRFDLFDRLNAELGPEFLDQRPVLAAQLALARERTDEAAIWAARALAAQPLANADAIALAGVFSGLNQPEQALALLNGVAGDPSTPAFALADLGAAYLQLGQAREGLALFRRLVTERSEQQVVEAWARLETVAGDAEAVLDWLGGGQRISAQALADVHYLAAERRADKLAYTAGDIYYQTWPGPESRRIHATSLIARGRAEDAVPILRELLPGDDEIAEAYALALSAVDRKPEALGFLRARANGEALPVRIADDYMALAIDLDQAHLAYAHARLHDMSRFDDNTIASIAENAAVDGDFELVDQIVEQTGPAFFARRPVMAARIEFARGNEEAARDWAEKARALEGLDNARTLRLARVYSDLNEIETSLGLLEGIAADPETPDFALSELAAQYLALGKEKRGLPIFRDLIAKRDEPLVREGWARIETRAGRPAAVLEWLRNASEPSRQVLTDLYFLAAQREAKQLALEASGQLFERFPGREARLIHGQALTAADRGREAIRILQPLLPGTREVRQAYVAALGQGGRTQDLVSFARQVLDDPELDPDTRSAILFGLLDAGAGDVALPRLRDLARRDPGTWEAAYLRALQQAGADSELAGLIETRLKAGPPRERRDELLFQLIEVAGQERALPYLRQAAEAEPAGTWPATFETALADLGRRKELLDWLVQRADLPGLNADQRREVAFRLLDLGAKRQAEGVFLDLATSSGPRSDDVQQLLFLWGPKPPERGRDWLAARTRRASAKDRGDWLKLLGDIRAYDQVIALAGDPPPADARDSRLEPLVTALIQTRQREAVSGLLDPVIARTEDVNDLFRMGDWAEQANRQRTAVRAYERAMDRVGDDQERLLKAARAFTFAGRAERAVETMERYFRADGNRADEDHRPWYYYAQSLSQMNRQPEARAAYREMLDVMAQSGAEDFESRRMEATAYEAIGDGERAVALYEELRAERPRDRSLLADFASLLIELRRYEQAELLLGQN